jgi:hypothetical protein
MRLALVGIALVSLACQQKGPVGVWEMGPITKPKSSFEDQFSGASWASTVKPGSQIFLAEGGAMFGAGAPIEEARLEQQWRSGDIHFSFTSINEHKVPLRSSFQGSYDAAADVIRGTFSQVISFGQIEVSLSGEASFTRPTMP